MKFNDGLQAVQKDKDDSGNDEKHDTTFISTKSGTTTLLVDSTDSIVFNDKNSVLITTPPTEPSRPSAPAPRPSRQPSRPATRRAPTS